MRLYEVRTVNIVTKPAHTDGAVPPTEAKEVLIDTGNNYTSLADFKTDARRFPTEYDGKTFDLLPAGGHRITPKAQTRLTFEEATPHE